MSAAPKQRAHPAGSATPGPVDLSVLDPLGRLLTRPRWMTPAWIAVIVLVWGFVWRLAVPRLAGMQGAPSLDGLLLSFIELPFFWAYFVWSRRQLSELFASVTANDLLEEAPARYAAFVGEVAATLSRAWVWAVPLAVSVGLTAWQALAWGGRADIWYEPRVYPLYAAGELLMYTASQYVVVSVLVTEVVVILAFRRLFADHALRVHPSFPDRAGGWGEVGRHAAGLSLFAVAFATWMTGMTLSVESQSLFPSAVKLALWFAFSLIAPALFFLPLLSAHDAMKRFKYGLLLGVSSRLNGQLAEARDGLDRPDFDRKGALAAVSELAGWEEFLDKSVPTWPFPRARLPRIAASWLLPLLTGLLTNYAYEYLKGIAR